MSRRRAVVVMPTLLVLLLAAWRLADARSTAPQFDHAEHAKLFPGSCTTCHLGAATEGTAIWPTAASCATCHDGTVETRVEWQPPTSVPPTNLRFTHQEHRAETRDSVPCASCHVSADAPTVVHRGEAQECVDCHEPGVAHLAATDRECARCHVPLTEAVALPDARIAAFEAPPSHDSATFGFAGHGPLAKALTGGRRPPVAASCSTCHAREFCLVCHVNAPEVEAIQALGPDRRSLLLHAELVSPPSHAAATFVTAHGKAASRGDATCASCHAQPSCTACHVAPGPREIRDLPMPGPGRGPGAEITRAPPVSHTTAFREGHGPDASSQPQACATCHVRTDCLNCHRGGPSTAGDYHPAGFLTRHPSAAYSRQTSCSDCHNTQQFCVTCHAQAGLGARNTLNAGPYHDAKGTFIVGHGQAARQSLESCVSCHVERDCTVCHSAQGGRRFNPHGPGFDAERLRRRNPEMCIACHGRAIPGAP
jgi:hypothetical protein